MKALVVREFADPTALKVDDFPEPQIKAGEALVRVKATAINFVDSLVVTGKYQFLPPRPFVPGKLPVGVVEAVGAGVTNLRAGDRVLTLAETGGYGEKVAVKAADCFALPEKLSFTDAASIALAYDTAWFALRERARCAAGESVLVLGATGSVGYAAMQLAKAMGLKVIAGIRSLAKADVVKAQGADEVIDIAADNLRDSLRDQVHAVNGGKGVDIILDPLGGDYFDAALRALAWRGRLVVIGFASGRIPSVKANYLLLKNIEVSGVQVSDYRKRTPELMAACIAEIFAMYERGQIAPEKAQVFPLADVGRVLAGELKSDGRAIVEL